MAWILSLVPMKTLSWWVIPVIPTSLQNVETEFASEFMVQLTWSMKRGRKRDPASTRWKKKIDSQKLSCALYTQAWHSRACIHIHKHNAYTHTSTKCCYYYDYKTIIFKRKKRVFKGWAWWPTSTSLELRRLRKENQEFKGNLSCMEWTYIGEEKFP